jgi:four helix bundle protein
MRISKCEIQLLAILLGTYSAIAFKTCHPNTPGMKKELELRTKLFALDVINFIAALPSNRTCDVIGRQLLKSGTSMGANYREAGRAESHADFIHKIAICEKEAAETQYWLELFLESKLVQPEKCERLQKEACELLAIFVASGRTAKASR